MKFQNPFNHPAWIDISILLARVALGMYMLIAGWNKMRDIPGFVNGSFAKMTPAWLPDSIARPYGYVLPALEVLCGLALMLGFFSRLAAGVITFLLVSIAVASISATGTLAGGAPGPMHHSIVFATLAFVLTIVGSGRLALDPLYFGGIGPDEGGGGRKKK
jgi:uncharacterized membrane protein YphA (DoxX/SURF4 family)